MKTGEPAAAGTKITACSEEAGNAMKRDRCELTGKTNIWETGFAIFINPPAGLYGKVYGKAMQVRCETKRGDRQFETDAPDSQIAPQAMKTEGFYGFPPHAAQQGKTEGFKSF